MTTPSITFVLCVEAGSLEGPTRRAVASLRRWGGRFANCPVYAVQPRFGPPLSGATKREFRDLGVRHLAFRRRDGYEWYPLLNKLAAVKAVEEVADTEAVGFLDSDLLVVGEPAELILGPGEDVVVSPSDAATLTGGPGDAWEAYWQHLAAVSGVPLDALPWVTTHREGKRCRFGINSGVYAYRRATKFGAFYHDFVLTWLAAKFASTETKVFFHEQQGFSFAVHKAGLRVRLLPHSHNYEMGGGIHAEWFREDKLRAAKIVHYHDCLWPAFFPTFLEEMRKAHPEVANFLAARGPLRNEAKPWWKAFGKWLHAKRKKAEAEYLAGCKMIQTGK